MNSPLRPLFAAAVLATTLYAPGALAALIVSGSTETATIGAVTSVNPHLNVLNDGLSASEVTLSAIETWDFKLVWGAPLTLNKANSTFKIGATTYNGFSDLFANFFGGANYDEPPVGAGEYRFNWADTTNFSTLDLANGFEFVAAFDIDSGAAAGSYDITFGPVGLESALTADTGAMEFPYSNVSSGQNPMRVILNAAASVPVPEPGVLGLLLGGLGVMGAARLRRRNSL